MYGQSEQPLTCHNDLLRLLSNTFIFHLSWLRKLLEVHPRADSAATETYKPHSHSLTCSSSVLRRSLSSRITYYICAKSYVIQKSLSVRLTRSLCNTDTICQQYRHDLSLIQTILSAIQTILFVIQTILSVIQTILPVIQTILFVIQTDEPVYVLRQIEFECITEKNCI